MESTSTEGIAPPCLLMTENIVCGAHLGSRLDLLDVLEVLCGRYDPSIFPAVVTKVKDSGDTCVSIFRSGHIIISGASSEMQAIFAGHLVVDKLNQDLHRADLRIFNFTINNLVAAGDLGYDVDLNVMNEYRHEELSYFPEVFEGLHWRTENPKIGFGISGGGKVIATGLRKFSDIVDVAQERVKQVWEYRVGNKSMNKESVSVDRRFDNRRKKRKKKKQVTTQTAAAAVDETRIQQSLRSTEAILKQREEKERKRADELMPFLPIFPQRTEATRQQYKCARYIEYCNKRKF